MSGRIFLTQATRPRKHRRRGEVPWWVIDHRCDAGVNGPDELFIDDVDQVEYLLSDESAFAGMYGEFGIGCC